MLYIILTAMTFGALEALPEATEAQILATAETEPIMIFNVCAPPQGLEPLIPNDPQSVWTNSQRIDAIMAAAPAGSAIFFPAGNYYFAAPAKDNGGIIETTHPGQIIYGEGSDVTHLIACDARPNFGVSPYEGYEGIQSAVVRLQHKGCALRDLTVMLDPRIGENLIVKVTAIQIAHIAYSLGLHNNREITVIDTDGPWEDFLMDHVFVQRVNVGKHIGPGIVGSRFFEVGVDIIGSGGHVRVSDMDRIDALTGIRLNNGNHCGQGEYLFRNCHMIGKVGLTDNGVFFDWVGGQAPQLEMCSASFISGFHAGPRGIKDLTNRRPMGSVRRMPERDWDWLTWHSHPVVAEPNHAQRTEWFGLVRHASDLLIMPSPGVGSSWQKDIDYTLERVTDDAYAEATKIHWISENRPAPNAVYFVKFDIPKEYLPHDLEWGNLLNCSFQEANQAGPNAYAIKFEDQEVGILNPDFGFRPGYGFALSNTFIINGDVIFEGAVDGVSMDATTAGVCNLRIRGRDKERPASNLTFLNNRFNSVIIGDFIETLTLNGNEITGSIKLEAEQYAANIDITHNTIRHFQDTGIQITGNANSPNAVRDLRIQDNNIRQGGGNSIGIDLNYVRYGHVFGNRVAGVQRAMQLNMCEDVLESGNLFHDLFKK